MNGSDFSSVWHAVLSDLRAAPLTAARVEVLRSGLSLVDGGGSLNPFRG